MALRQAESVQFSIDAMARNMLARELALEAKELGVRVIWSHATIFMMRKLF